jgi:trans-2,3-dihydro-3-hydroxyanthranilate isomerase
MLPFAIYDVFSDRAYAGNQLAVVFDGQALTTAQMQAIALEFNFSETVFVLPAAAPGADYLARIFTPAEELPFAGHPTIGAAIAAVASGRVEPDGGTVVQECGAGLMTSAGLDHNFVRLADEDVPAAADVPGHLEKVYLFSFDEDSNAVHARLFHRGVGEDPATGSAAVALGVHLVDQGLISGDGVHAYEIAQGAEIGRPSTLHGEVVVENGAAVSVSVAGAAVKTAEGTLVTLP